VMVETQAREVANSQRASSKKCNHQGYRFNDLYKKGGELAPRFGGEAPRTGSLKCATAKRNQQSDYGANPQHTGHRHV
jgi:hypothetical protein